MKKQALCIFVIAGSIFSLNACSDDQQAPVTKDVSQKRHAIINGTKDTKVAHNAIVALYDKSEKYAFCTGTLIHEDWVLTAAHCVANDDGTSLSSGFVSNTQIGVGNNENALSLYAVSAAYFNSSYGDRYINNNQNKYTLDGDIALIKLKKSIPASVAEPILPHPKWLTISESDLPITAEFVGFGYDEDGGSGVKLTYTGEFSQYCPITSSCQVGTGYCKMGSYKVQGCHPADQKSNGSCKSGTSVDYTDSVYAPCGSIFNPQYEGGTCNGDSGGPALDTIGGIQYVEGITSYGDEICTVYGLSTSVLDYQDWIEDIAPEVYEQYVEVCGNGYDDDGDGDVDDADSDCSGSGGSEVITAYCGDGLVNNEEECDGESFRDGKTTCAEWNADYVSGSVSCTSSCAIDYGACVKASVCGNGELEGDEACDGAVFSGGSSSCSAYNAYYATGSLSCTSKCTISTDNCVSAADSASTSEVCDDGVDNDGNGKTDCKDKACYYDAACAEDCANGVDDDGDGFTDCDDFYCSSAAECTASSSSSEVCDDGIDNDGNGKTDCKDKACYYDAACAEDCTNGVDDDGDGYIDCKDYYCSSAAVCNGGSALEVQEICGNGLDDDSNGYADCDDEACQADASCAFSDEDDSSDEGSGASDPNDDDSEGDSEASDPNDNDSGDDSEVSDPNDTDSGDDSDELSDGSDGTGVVFEGSDADSGTSDADSDASDADSAAEESGSVSDESGVTESGSHGSSDSCSAAPLKAPTGGAPFSAALLGLLGVFGLVRRRREH